MSFSDAVSDGFSNYANFSGRSSRPAYWWWVLFGVLASAAGSIVDQVLGTGFVFASLVGLALLIPGLAVLVRRFHDAGHSGWWVLILLLPLIGLIVWLLFALTESQPPNQWGQGPDAAAAA